MTYTATNQDLTNIFETDGFLSISYLFLAAWMLGARVLGLYQTVFSHHCSSGFKHRVENFTCALPLLYKLKLCLAKMCQSKICQSKPCQPGICRLETSGRLETSDKPLRFSSLTYQLFKHCTDRILLPISSRASSLKAAVSLSDEKSPARYKTNCLNNRVRFARFANVRYPVCVPFSGSISKCRNQNMLRRNHSQSPDTVHMLQSASLG